MWSCWMTIAALETKYGIAKAQLGRWESAGYAVIEMRKPDGLTAEMCVRIRGLLGVNPIDELKLIEATVTHAEKFALKGGGK